jgi:hypothetical protein
MTVPTKRPTRILEEVRERIQTVQLINRLHHHALGTIEMSATQLRAAEILIKKVLPDLSSISHSGDADNPIEHKVLVTGVMRPADHVEEPKLIGPANTIDVTST